MTCLLTFFAETHFPLIHTNDLVNISFVSYSRHSAKNVGRRKKGKATTWTEKIAFYTIVKEEIFHTVKIGQINSGVFGVLSAELSALIQ